MYGANKSLLSLIKTTTSDIEWYVVCREEGEFIEILREMNVKCYVIPYNLDIYEKKGNLTIIKSVVKLLINIALLPYIYILVIRNNIKIIHSNSSIILIGAFTSLITNRPHVWHFREFGDIDYGFTYNFGNRFFKYFSNKSEYIICVSKALYKHKVLLNKLKTKCKVIYNGIEINYKSNKELDCISSHTHKPYNIAIIGLIHPAKNQLVAIKAAKLLINNGENINLRIIGGIGDKEYYLELIEFIKENNLSAYIEFCGFKNNISTVFHDTAISLVCSENEAMGRVSIESMLNYIPVVAYNSAGNSEIINNYVTGILYRGGEYELQEAIKLVIDNSALRLNIQKNGFDYAKSNYSLETYRESFLEVINSLKG
ncbi:glycosyltransferase family 4 protein [Rhabdobacter roseus]